MMSRRLRPERVHKAHEKMRKQIQTSATRFNATRPNCEMQLTTMARAPDSSSNSSQAENTPTERRATKAKNGTKNGAKKQPMRGDGSEAVETSQQDMSDAPEDDEAEAHESEEDSEEDDGSPKGTKRVRVNEDSEASTAERKRKIKTRPVTLPRDTDGYGA